MTDNTAETVKPDAMNAAAVLLLQQFINEITSGDAVVTKLGGEDSEDDWSLNVSLMRNMPGTPKAPVAASAQPSQFKACPMCKQLTFHVEGKSCMNCEFVDD